MKNNNIRELTEFFSKIILGKNQQIKLTMACLLARGHLLIEDVPGVGKTTLALATAKAFNLDFQRIQFTNDLLPSDILGVSIYEQSTGNFLFQKGPIFSQLVLADEINRASPKTQSALLESMEEGQVSIEGKTQILPELFFVIATQNPEHQIGTFTLPESQIDRFLMRISLGYPEKEAELALLMEKERSDMLKESKPFFDTNTLIDMQNEVKKIYTDKNVLHYILDLVQSTREHEKVNDGLSPRATLALKRSSQAWAYIEGKEAVTPEDVQEVFIAVAEHRLYGSENSKKICEDILKTTAIP